MGSQEKGQVGAPIAPGQFSATLFPGLKVEKARLEPLPGEVIIGYETTQADVSGLVLRIRKQQRCSMSDGCTTFALERSLCCSKSTRVRKGICMEGAASVYLACNPVWQGEQEPAHERLCSAPCPEPGKDVCLLLCSS